MSDPVTANRNRVRLGETIRDARKRRGLSQDVLAARLRTSQSAISRLELGDAEDPGIRLLTGLAGVLGLRLEDLIALAQDEQVDDRLATPIDPDPREELEDRVDAIARRVNALHEEFRDHLADADSHARVPAAAPSRRGAPAKRSDA